MNPRWFCFLAAFAGVLLTPAQPLTAQVSTNPITREVVAHAEMLLGLDFSEAKLDMLLGGLQRRRTNYENLRKIPLSNSVPPALIFNPVPAGMTFDTRHKPPHWSSPGKVKVPTNPDDLAFYSVGDLAVLIKSKKISSEQLTHLYLDRLKKYGPRLQCVITLTEELALDQARRADREIASGKYRGPLHGIPYGAKDLLAAKGFRTTWGSVPFKEQVINEDATVIQRLEQAGAVLVAKLTLGELAMGDVWYGGQTRNPWDPKQGSSGSSAGSAATVAGGLVAFAIGSETYGSIVSPSTVCGTTGLRPTFGRVSRAGAMTLSWSMDKLGPLCRSVEDCALVFNAIYGPDGIDQSVQNLPFNYDARTKITKLRIGYLKGDFDRAQSNKTNDLATIETLEKLGVKLIPVELPRYPINDLSFVLNTEGAAAFDELTRSGRDDLLVRQTAGAWPSTFRLARFVPAVEYLQANRIRYLLIQEFAKQLAGVDVFLAPSQEGNCLLMTNLTGHPCVVLSNGFTSEGLPRSICFIGRLYDEEKLLAVAGKLQDATPFHLRRPPLVHR